MAGLLGVGPAVQAYRATGFIKGKKTLSFEEGGCERAHGSLGR